MIPLPVKFQHITAKIITHDQSIRFISLYRLFHNLRHMSVRITQHRPSVNPPARHNSQDTTYTAPVLEYHTVPFTITVVNDSTLCHIRKPSKRIFQYYTFLIRTGNSVRSVAYLPTVSADWPRNHYQIILSVMFYYPAAFQKAVFIFISFEYFHINTTRLNISQIRLKFAQLSCTIKHIDSAIVVKKQGGIMEVWGS